MRLLILFIPLLWLGCQPVSTNKAKEKYFDLPAFSQKLLKSQVKINANVIKTMQVNGIQEKRKVENTDSIFWATELFPLLNGNLNKPSLMDAYVIERDIPDESSNLLKTVYTALPGSNAAINKLEIKYLGPSNEVRQVIVLIDNKNAVYSTQQLIQLWVNKHNGLPSRQGNVLLIDSIFTGGFNKTILLDSMKYASKVVVVR